MLELKTMHRREADWFGIHSTKMDTNAITGTIYVAVPPFTARTERAIQRTLNTGYLDGIKGMFPFWSQVIMHAYHMPYLQFSSRSTYDRSWTVHGLDYEAVVRSEFDPWMRLMGYKPQSSWYGGVNYSMNQEAWERLAAGKGWREGTKAAKQGMKQHEETVVTKFQEYFLRPIGWEPGMEIPDTITVEL